VDAVLAQLLDDGVRVVRRDGERQAAHLDVADGLEGPRRHVRAILSAGVRQQFDLANVLHVEHAQLRTTAHTSVVEVVDRRASAKNGDAALVADDARDLP